MTASTYDKRRLIEWLRAETARATGRRYQIDFDALDVQSLRELVRLIRDLDHEAGRREPSAHDAVAASLSSAPTCQPRLCNQFASTKTR